MSHSHKHSHDQSTYYMEQLCTIGACGALGAVVVLLYFQRTADNQRTLDFILARYLHPYVLGSGLAILSVVALRGLFLWFSVGRRTADHHHDHQHAVECCPGHDHDHADHDHAEGQHEHDDNYGHHHDHGHVHGWNPWRYIVICLPIMLFFLGLPNEGFRSVKAMEIEGSDREVAEKQGGVIHLNFKELDSSAYSESKRDYFEGRTGVLKGQFVLGKNPNIFGLVRQKITCCAADVITLNVAIISPESVVDVPPMSWVEVTGQIQYRKRKDRDQYVPVLKLRSRNDIALTVPDDDPYLQ